MRGGFKKVWLVIQYSCLVLCRWLKSSVVLIPVIISALLFLMIFATNLAHRAPILDYFIEEINLPMTFSLAGRVVIKNDDGSLNGVDAEISIGGYRTETDIDGNFVLKFASPNGQSIPVIIAPTNIGENLIYYISYSKNIYETQKEFCVNE